MKVAIVHDDLVQWGGAERVLEGICEMYPDAPIFTSLFDYPSISLGTGSNNWLLKRFGSKKIITSFLQKIPGWKTLYKALLPLYPVAFEQFDFSGYDLVISHTTRFAKSIITKPETKHVCYMHSPPRFLWNFSGETPHKILEPYFKWLRRYDRVSARRPDLILAGSENVKKRIKDMYGLESKVLYPFIDLKRFEGVETFDGGYFLVISRLNKYKRVDLAVEACTKLGIPLKVIGSGSEMGNLRENDGVEFLGNLDDKMVVKVLAGAKALIIPGIEDFGLTSIEAQALGKSVISYGFGGVLETVIEGRTGIFFDKQEVNSLIEKLKKFEPMKFAQKDCKINAIKFSKEVFIRNFKHNIASL